MELTFDMKKVRIASVDEVGSYSVAFYDVTDLLTLELPPYIKKIEIAFCDIFNYERATEAHLRKEFLRHFDNNVFIEAGRIKNDSMPTRVTFTDGSSLDAANSEWGSITLIPPES